jgi:hypothetical protein
MISKLNKIKTWQASLVIIGAGILVYFDGLKNQFLGDDSLQIVKNVPVHSISHVAILFQGGTFYTGNGLAPLSGVYFRPLMMAFYSLLYTIFGSHPLYFHVFQLCICIGSTILLYAFFRFSFKPVLALFLALIFLLHPLNSEVVFAISTLQDALFFFFGILALYLLARYKTIGSMIASALCLMLSLFAKETGVVFVVVALLYLFWYGRKRLLPFVGALIIPMGLWLVLKINAIGFIGTNPNNAPIDKLDLTQRLMTAPSIVLFYITKFIFPWKLASGYYWTFPKFNFTDVLLPFIVDIAVIGLIVYGGRVIHKRKSKAHYYTYAFFACWAGVGLLTTLQIIPVDMTASETWFYFPMVGVLGMIGIATVAFAKDIDGYIEVGDDVLIGIMVTILLILGVRSIVRGPDWSSFDNLSANDVQASKEDYIAYGIESIDLSNKKDYKQALIDDQRSVTIFPNGTAYTSLCKVDYAVNQRHNALAACNRAMTYSGSITQDLYTSTALLRFLYDSPKPTEAFIQTGLKKYPKDGNLWLYLALDQYQYGNKPGAKNSIQQAYMYLQSPTVRSAYAVIMDNKKLVM